MEKPVIIEFNKLRDRGAWLSFAENPQIPFRVNRVFYLTGIKEKMVRGEHAHRTSRQLLIAIQGSMHVTLENTRGESLEFLLEQDHQALFIPPMYWGRMTMDTGTIALALASDPYSEADYIRDYQEFRSQ